MAAEDRHVNIRLDQLVCHPQNYRLGDIPAIAKSIRTYGFNRDIVVRLENGQWLVYAGNHAVKALREIRRVRRKKGPPHGVDTDADGEWVIPCVSINHLSDSAALGYLVADNRTQEKGDEDPKALASILELVRDTDPAAFDATGYTADDLAKFVTVANLGDDAEPQEDTNAETSDSVDSLQAKWNVEKGQLWSIASRYAGGTHLLYCGDATRPEDVQRVLSGRAIQCVVTDPPFSSNERSAEAYRLSNAPAIYTFSETLSTADALEDLREAGYTTLTSIAWVKPTAMDSSCQYRTHHVLLWYSVHPQAKVAWCGDRKQTSLWQFDNYANGKGEDFYKTPHPSQRSVTVYEKAYRNHCRTTQCVYEPFGGSGTAWIAAERSGLTCVGLEIDPRYCAVILERLEVAGLKPVRIA